MRGTAAVILAILWLGASAASAATVTVSPTSCTNVEVDADYWDWQNTSQAVSDDGLGANTTVTSGFPHSNNLYCKFNASGVPDGATINDVSFAVDKQGSTNTGESDWKAQIMDDDGTTVVGTNQAAAGEWPSSPSWGVTTYAGLWGLTFCAASAGDCPTAGHTNVKDADFGFVIAIQYSGGASSTAQVDTVQLTIDYTAPTATPTVTPTPTITHTFTPSLTPTSTRTPTPEPCGNLSVVTLRRPSWNGEIPYASIDADCKRFRPTGAELLVVRNDTGSSVTVTVDHPIAPHIVGTVAAGKEQVFGLITRRAMSRSTTNFGYARVLFSATDPLIKAGVVRIVP